MIKKDTLVRMGIKNIVLFIIGLIHIAGFFLYYAPNQEQVLAQTDNQFVLIDKIWTHSTANNKAFSFFPIPASVPSNWVSPVNFAQGTVYMRLKVLTKPSNKGTSYQICIFQGGHVAANHACGKRQQFTTTGTYIWNEPLPNWFQYANHNWAQPMTDQMLVVKDAAGNPIDDRYGNAGKWDGSPNFNLYYPMDVQFTAVVVRQGGVFSGWPDGAPTPTFTPTPALPGPTATNTPTPTNIPTATPTPTGGVAPTSTPTPTVTPTGTPQPACTHYVSLTGSNNNTGTSLNLAWQTLTFAASKLNPGDTLCIAPGNYNERMILNRPGLAGQVITVRALDPANRPIIDGKAGVDSINSGLPPAAPVRCDTDIVHPQATGRCHNWGGVVSVQANYITIDGIVTTRSMGRGLSIFAVDPAFIENVRVLNSEISYARASTVLFERARNIEFINNVVHHSGMFAPFEREPTLNWGGAIALTNSSSILIKKNTVHTAWGEGIMFDSQNANSSNITVEDNTLFNIWRPQIYVHGARDSIIRRNLIYSAPTTEFPVIPFGGIVIRDTEANFTPNFISENILVANNILVKGGDTNFIFSKSKNIAVLHNTFVNGFTGAIKQPTGVADSRFINNIIYQDAGDLFVGSGVGMTFSNNAWSRQPPTLASSTSDIVGDPRLKNPTQSIVIGVVDPHMYEPLSGSPVLNKAQALTEVTDDYFSKVRNPPAELGAIELTDNLPCTGKARGDADCNGSIQLADFEIWRKEYFAACTAANRSACFEDSDNDGDLMDANFDYLSAASPAVEIVDFEIWRKGYFGI